MQNGADVNIWNKTLLHFVAMNGILMESINFNPYFSELKQLLLVSFRQR